MKGSVKLRKIKTREHKGKKYYRWDISIPEDMIKNLDWEEGQEIQAEIRGKKLILKPEEE